VTGGEGLRRFLRRAKVDPTFFCRILLSKVPHPGQVTWLENSTQAINVLVPGNRWGKSTVIAMKHIWKAFTKHKVVLRPGETWLTAEYETISVSVSADQAEIVFKEVKRLLAHPVIAPFVTSIRSTPFPTIKLWNGAIINCRSAHDDGKYIDGHAYRYVSIDEAGWIKNLRHLMDGVILMRLAGGGDVDLIGTPKGFGDLYWYYSRGERGVEGYYAQRGSIYDNPHLSPEDLKMRDRLLQSSNPKMRDQVIKGAFVDLEGLAFTQDQREQAFQPDLPAHQDRVAGHRYLQAWDLGRKTDYTVGVTLDVTTRPWVMVDFVRLNKVPWEQIYTLINDKRKEYGVALPRIDATGPQGDVIEEELWKRGIPHDPYKTSTGVIKLNLINTLQSALDYGRRQVGTAIELDEAGIEHEVPLMQAPGEGNWGLLRMPCIPQLLDEFGVYMLDDKDLVQDCIMATALAVEIGYDGTLLMVPAMGPLMGSEQTDGGWAA
jgi:hypothetical protein